MADSSIADIFSNIVEGFFQHHDDAIKAKLTQVVNSTIFCYNEAMTFLLPIPQKSHYLFNLRDVAKVFQGMCNAKPAVLPDTPSFVRLWVHEMNRVFKDRLLDKKDNQDFDNLIKRAVTEKLETEEELIFSKPRILFGDFMDKDPENRVYREIEDLKALTTVLEDILEE